jgi:hypothetical protein
VIFFCPVEASFSCICGLLECLNSQYLVKEEEDFFFFETMCIDGARISE